MQPRWNGRYSLRPLLAGFCSLALLTGCSAVLVAPYDETTDRLLTDLSVKTQTAVVQADADKLSEADREKFYDESIGAVRTMKARASLFLKNQDEVNALGQLEQRYQDLRQRNASPRSSLTTGLRATLLDVQQIEIAKKRSSVFSAGLKKSSGAP